MHLVDLERLEPKWLEPNWLEPKRLEPKWLEQSDVTVDRFHVRSRCQPTQELQMDQQNTVMPKTGKTLFLLSFGFPWAGGGKAEKGRKREESEE